MGEIGTRAGNGSLELGDRTVVGFWPEMENDGAVAVCSGFGDQKFGYREEDVLHWFRTVAGTGRRPEMEDDRNWKTVEDGRQPELEERRYWPELEERRSWPKMENYGGGSCAENGGGGKCVVVNGGKILG
jgi:hypothetical protein